ncbi:CoA pyrophosphatase [Sphingomonas sp.]|uniref:CoA pyrophosphatase n=1 Tax=Sphingomonas sp. TaxID=28214 RepID=UPI002FCA1C81
MTLAERLRRALDQGLADSLMLIEADSRALLERGPTTPAAVLVAIVDRPDPTVILTMRTDTIRRHPGQVAFPGGRVDPEDEDVIAAALREAEEEIGLPRDQVEIVGIADLYRTITGYEVTPVIGIVPPDLPLTPQPDEVAAIFEVPLRHLIAPEHQVMRTMERNGQEHFYYEIEWEDRRIWGATAGMIVNLSRRLAFLP